MKLSLKTEHPGMLLVSLFYAVVGSVLAFILVYENFRLFHVGALAILNLMLAYGLLRMKKWSAKLLVALFLPQIVFGVITVYYAVVVWRFPSTWETTAFNLSLIVYVALCFVSLVYVLAKRKELK